MQAVTVGGQPVAARTGGWFSVPVRGADVRLMSRLGPGGAQVELLVNGRAVPPDASTTLPTAPASGPQPSPSTPPRPAPASTTREPAQVAPAVPASPPRDPLFILSRARLRDRETAAWSSIALTVGSMVAFVLLGAIPWGPRFSALGSGGLRVSLLRMAVLLAVAMVIAVHELGHALAMWALGWRVRRIVFVPFRGAFTEGEPARTSPAREALVALAGPVFGIALPVVLFGFDASRGLMGLTLLVNGFNLLPLPGFDGGRALGAAFFWDRPDPAARVLAARLDPSVERLEDQPEAIQREVYARARRLVSGEDPQEIAAAMRVVYNRAARSPGTAVERGAALGGWILAVWMIAALVLSIMYR